MNTKLTSRSRRALPQWLWLLTVSGGLLSPPARAGFSEPYNLVYGQIEVDGQRVGASDTGITVEARRFLTAGVVASYRMGFQRSAGDFYALKIKLETVAPLSDERSVVLPGTTLYITMLVNGQARGQLEFVVGERGAVRRLDFGAIDTDGDGLPDGWEQAYLITLGYGPADDPDRDGLSNFDEYGLGTHPMRADAPHPADINPRDNRISIAELSAYYVAWKTGRAWTIAPTNIPIEYVTRASAIWEAGEYYRLDLGMTNPPLWWVSAPAPTNAGFASVSPKSSPPSRVAPLGLEEEPGPLRVTAELPTQFQAGEPAVVAYQVEIASGLRAYAVEDQPPAGWRVVSFSPGGSYDAKNRKLKWGPFLDRQPRVLTYTVLPDLVSDGQAFTGVGSYDGYRVRMLGRRTVGAEVPASEVVRLEVSTQPYAWSVRGQPGAAYVVEVSSDLLHWQPLTNGTTDALGRWIFLPGSDAPCNFFRAMQPAALNGGTR